MNRLLFINSTLVVGLAFMLILSKYSAPEDIRERIKAEFKAQFDQNVLNNADNYRYDSLTISKRNKSYRNTLSGVVAKRLAFALEYEVAPNEEKKSVLERAEAYLFTQLTKDNGVLDHWMGTPWDYSGITEQPLVDSVACGYFISTPLKHCGFNLNRYKLAQQYSHSIVNSLCPAGQIKVYNDLDAALTFAQQFKNTLYVVGLDNHVGFVANIDDEIFFIHSNYQSPGVVVKEPAEESSVLGSSDIYVIGRLLGDNPALVRQWLSGSSISIVP